MNALQIVIAKKGQAPEASRDRPFAHDLLEKVQETQKVLDAATSVLLELEKR